MVEIAIAKARGKEMEVFLALWLTTSTWWPMDYQKKFALTEERISKQNYDDHTGEHTDSKLLREKLRSCSYTFSSIKLMEEDSPSPLNTISIDHRKLRKRLMSLYRGDDQTDG